MDESVDDAAREQSSGRQNKREGEHEESCSTSGLKKARYAWQVKGALKNAREVNPSEEQNHDTAPQSDTEGLNNNLLDSTLSGESCSEDTSISSCNNFSESNMSSEETHTDSVSVEPCDGNIALLDHETRVRNITESYLERRAPFDLFRTTVNMVANPHCQWQKQELGCAIVDNVFNRTLEEIGISPDPKVNVIARFIEQALENQGIESAIQNRGLQARMSQNLAHSRQEASVSSTVDYEQERTRPQHYGHSSNYSNRMQVSESLSAASESVKDVEKDRDKQESISCDLVNSGTSDFKSDLSPHNERISNSHAMNCSSECDAPVSTVSQKNLEAEMVDHKKLQQERTCLTVIEGEAQSSLSSSAELSEKADPSQMLDLAVSTAIKSQGLSVKLN